MKSYLFFGAPGSGKGTQFNLLVNYFKEKNLPSCSIETGQKLREYFNSKETPSKKKVAEMMERGELVPSVYPSTMWVQGIMEHETECEHFLIDGAGRKLVEAKLVTEFLFSLAGKESSEINVFLLQLSKEDAVKRLLERGRYDDKKDVFETRFKFYLDDETGTMASINFLKNHPNKSLNFYEINGNQEVDAVFKDIISKIEK